MSGKRVEKDNNAPFGNRTRGKRLEGVYVTTTPMVLADKETPTQYTYSTIYNTFTLEFTIHI